jgi:hypothetical protein
MIYGAFEVVVDVWEFQPTLPRCVERNLVMPPSGLKRPAFRPISTLGRLALRAMVSRKD